MAYGTMLSPSSGVLSAYESQSELRSAIGIFLISWFLVTFFILIASLRKSVTYIALFLVMDLSFLLLAIAQFANSSSITKAGGVTAIMAAIIAFYAALFDLLVPEDRWFWISSDNANGSV
jgi:succinate-acetate transporter protein